MLEKKGFEINFHIKPGNTKTFIHLKLFDGQKTKSLQRSLKK